MGNGDESGWVAPSTPEGNSLRISALACHLAFTHESLPVHCPTAPEYSKVAHTSRPDLAYNGASGQPQKGEHNEK